MKFSELAKVIERAQVRHDDPEVVIRIKLPYSTVGAQPTVTVKNANMGFDWDSGKFIITPEEELTPSDRDFAKQMTEMQERVGWTDYENRNLKSENKRLKKQLKEKE
jgi:hypothetical protein